MPNPPLLSLTLKNICLSLLRIVLVLIGVAYFTLAERKIMASIQRRRGPNVVGIFGLLQPLADGLKLLCKEMVVPTKANAVVFLVAPIAIITLSLLA
jgi:NADH:ubiquinone oxidoreductase subunit H